MRVRHPARGANAAIATTLLILIAACAAVPYQAMSDARQAIESARPVVTDSPGPRANVERAQSLLDEAERHLHDGEYEPARAKAERAKAIAIEARERARTDDRAPGERGRNGR